MPVSFSRVAICCETAEGVSLSASAAAMMVPRSWISVSYTHLDVYKRQESAEELGCEDTESAGIAGGIHEGG